MRKSTSPYNLENLASHTFLQERDHLLLTVYQLIDPPRLNVEEISDSALLSEIWKMYGDVTKIFSVDSGSANCSIFGVTNSSKARHHLSDEPSRAKQMV